jgi:hypothetical protein
VGASSASKEQKKYLAQLERAAQQNKAITDRAEAISEKYGTEIDRVGNLGAGAVAGNLSTGTNVVGSGNAAIASQSASARMQALGQAQQAELAGTGQALTGQAQTASALTNALSGANVQQQQSISGFGSAAGLAAPVQIAPGSTLASPVGGETIAGGLGGYANYQTAEQVMGLIRQYPDANYIYDQTKTPQENLMAAQAAIQGSPAYQKGMFGAPGQSTIAGGTAIQTAQAGYQSSYQTFNQLSTQKNTADQLAGNLLGVMQAYGINPAEARFANEKLKDLRRQFGSEGQAAYDTAVKEVQAAYSNLLAMGGGVIPTEATEASNTLLNPNATLGQITAAIEQLKTAGQFRLNEQGNLVNTYWSQLQSNPIGGGSAGGGAGNPYQEEWL